MPTNVYLKRKNKGQDLRALNLCVCVCMCVCIYNIFQLNVCVQYPGGQPRTAVWFSWISLVKRGKKESKTTENIPHASVLGSAVHILSFKLHKVFFCTFLCLEKSVSVFRNLPRLASSTAMTESRPGPTTSVFSRSHVPWSLNLKADHCPRQPPSQHALRLAFPPCWLRISTPSLMLPSALQMETLGVTKWRRLPKRPRSFGTMEWPRGAGHCPAVGSHVSFPRAQGVQGRLQCVPHRKTSPGRDTCPQISRLPHRWAHAQPRVSHNWKQEPSPPAAGLWVLKPHLCFYVCVGMIQRKLLVKRITIATFNRHPACKLESGKPLSQ